MARVGWGLLVIALGAGWLVPTAAAAPTNPGPGVSPTNSYGVSLQGVRYVPADITVRAGESVIWTHRDSGLFHHVGADDGTWDSNPTCGHPGGQCMRGGDTYSHVFLQPGTYGYHCRLHGQPGRGMAGTVRVLPG